MSLRVRILLTVAALLLLPVYSATAGDDATPLRITISPMGGPHSSQITVAGLGAQVGVPVQVMITADGNAGEGALTAIQVDPAASGGFAAAITVPADATAGRYAVRAEQRNAQGAVLQYYWVGLRVGSVLNPATGALPETALTLTAILATLLMGLMAFQGVRLALRRQ